MKIFEKPLIFVKKVKELYEKTTNKAFLDLIPEVMEYNRKNQEKKLLSVVDLALYEVLKVENLLTEKKENIPMLKILSDYYEPKDINLFRRVEEFSLDDMVNIHNCLDFSQNEEYLLIHYNEIGVWINEFIPSTCDRWTIYDNFLTECRSVILDVKTMTIASLPFAKFRNMNEAEGYMQEEVEARIAKAKNIEFSNKLDGSMIQMKYLNDNRFWEGIIISTSGSINANKAYHLRDVLNYLNEHGEKIAKVVKDYADFTCLFEWIHGINDPHIVQYDPSEWGLHLIGMRNVFTGELKTYREVIEIAQKYDIPCTDIYSETLSTILSTLRNFKSSEKEGYVLNVDGFLVKIKCDDFVGMVKLFQNFSSFNTIVQAVANETVDDMLSKIPKTYHPIVKEKVQRLYDFEKTLTEIINQYFEQIPDGTKKDAMVFINEKVPKKLQKLVRFKYLNQELPIFVKFKDTSNPHYLKERELNDWEEL